MTDIPVSFTEDALGQVRQLAPANDGLPIRIYIEGKGCDGFTYGVAFDNPESNDLRFFQEDVEILIDPESLDFLAGASVTWVDDERGKGFLVENPNQRKFRGKFYKRKNWRDRLIN